ncbi:Putative F-box protein PP2-B12 [Apostasia shenzhenica]|uniref:F-box protein PP2-B12 n=1 Tax=Apostasia shenzhenica TaxID=1088818 RepID=A0A2I0ADV6_9ASPA|nr:Putative F-box protein PP2-B12 [Apostasia shenzhenica]
MEDGGIGDILRLPEECLARAIALTSPRDACRSELVSAAFLAAAASDAVWERFLPKDYLEILSRAVKPINFAGKKHLYFRLCDYILIDNGKMSFVLDKETGAKCFMLAARELTIVWGENLDYWQWRHLPESRFCEVAELVNVCWLEIYGKIDSRILTKKANYAAYLVFKVAYFGSIGLSYPSQVLLKIGSYISSLSVSLSKMRQDGWKEVMIGEFYSGDGDDGEVELSLMETNGGHWKSGLIVQGIEIRVKNTF